MKKLMKTLCFLYLLISMQFIAAAEQAFSAEKLSVAKTISETVNPERIDYKTELRKLGYLKDESNDSALNLRNAVIRFQSSCNIAVNGKWDQKCLSILTERLQTGIASCQDVIGEPPASGKWIVINKTKRILTLYEGSKVIQKYPVAVGNPPSRTPEGKYTIVSKVINPSWGGGGYAEPVKGGVPENPLGYRWLGLSYKNGSTLGIHGNNSPYSIGKNVSHGCIRMINSDVTQLFTIVPRSAPVWIGTDAKLREWGVFQPEYGSKPVTPAKKSALPANDKDNGLTPDENIPPEEITADPGAAAPTTDGAIKVTYDEEGPTTCGAICIPPEDSAASSGGAVKVHNEVSSP